MSLYRVLGYQGVLLYALTSLLIASASAQSTTPVLPPRTTQDILKVLNDKAGEIDHTFVQLRQLADQSISPDLPPEQLARMYQRRAAAAGQLGRAVQEIRDLKSGLQTARATNLSKFKDQIAFQLGMAEIRAGDYELGRRLIEAQLTQQANAQAATMSVTALEGMARSGRMSEVDRARQQIDEVLFTLDDDHDLTEGQKASIRAALAHGQAMLLDMVGDLHRAQAAYESAIRSWNRFGQFIGNDPRARGQLRRITNLMQTRLAELFLRQGNFVAAEVASRRALLETLELNGRFSYQLATILQTFTRVIFEQGRFEEGALLAGEALNVYQRAGVSPTALNRLTGRALLADLFIAAEDWSSAEEVFAKLAEDLRDNPSNLGRFVRASTTYGLLNIQTGRLDDAAAVLSRAVIRLNRIHGPEGPETLETGALLAVAQSRQGNTDLARKSFDRYLPPLIKQFRERSANPTRRTLRDQRLEFILEEYIRTLLHADDSGLPSSGEQAEAFRITDLLRSRGLRAAIAASAARGAVNDSALAKLVRREQDTGLQIVGLESLVSDALARSNQTQLPDVTQLLARLSGLRKIRAGLLEDIKSQFPRYASLTNPEPATVAMVRRTLHQHETLLSIYSGRRGTYVFAVSREGGLTVHVSPLTRPEIEDIVLELRSSVDPGGITQLSDIPPFNLRLAHRLFQTLLGAIRPSWQQARTIIVSSHGLLASLPLAMLPTEQPAPTRPSGLGFDEYRQVKWLTRSHAVYVLPAVSTLQALRQPRRNNRHGRQFAGFGDPQFSSVPQTRQTKSGTRAVVRRGGFELRNRPTTWKTTAKTGQRSDVLARRSGPDRNDSVTLGDLPPLPDTALELRRVARSLGADETTDVHLGVRADETVIKSADLSNVRILSFATHGLITGDLDGLDEPALALSTPDVTKSNEDGLLKMSEIFGLRLNADWVVLSACNTAAGDGKGAEAVSGLGRAFFFAGTRAVLASNWPVHSEATAELMTTLFSKLATSPHLTRAEVLRWSQERMIDHGINRSTGGDPTFSYAHPIFWAPFTLMGDGGGNTTGTITDQPN